MSRWAPVQPQHTPVTPLGWAVLLARRSGAGSATFLASLQLCRSSAAACAAPASTCWPPLHAAVPLWAQLLRSWPGQEAPPSDAYLLAPSAPPHPPTPLHPTPPHPNTLIAWMRWTPTWPRSAPPPCCTAWALTRRCRWGACPAQHALGTRSACRALRHAARPLYLPWLPGGCPWSALAEQGDHAAAWRPAALFTTRAHLRQRRPCHRGTRVTHSLIR